MCDYSLHHAKSRPAVLGEELVTECFGHGSTGFKAVGDEGRGRQATAVCLLPGTQVALPEGYSTLEVVGDGVATVFRLEQKVAVFAKHIHDLTNPYQDTLEFPDGTSIKVARLRAGITARVLQLPASEVPAVQKTDGVSDLVAV